VLCIDFRAAMALWTVAKARLLSIMVGSYQKTIDSVKKRKKLFPGTFMLCVRAMPLASRTYSLLPAPCSLLRAPCSSEVCHVGC